MQTQSLLELTTRLVGYPTVSDSEDIKHVTGLNDMVDFIIEITRKHGFRTITIPHKSKLNVIATLGSSEIPELALSGHMDTVPYADWKVDTDPLTLTPGEIISGDSKLAVYYGRGVTDMKLYIAYMLKIAERLSGSSPTKPFALYFTCDEETGCAGAKTLIKSHEFRPANYIVIGEPTQKLPIRVHKGYIYFKITITSTAPNQTVHSSKPTNSINTLEHGLPEITDALVNILGTNLRKIQNDKHRPPYATLNLGKVIQSPSASKNIIPETTDIVGEIRTIFGQDPMAIKMLIEQLVTQVEAQANKKLPSHLRGHLKIKVSFVRIPTPAMITPAESQIVIAVENLTGQKSSDLPYNTEGGIFNQAGAECIIWGPGDDAQAHKANEYIARNYFDECQIDPYLEIIRQFCFGGV